MVRWSNTPWVKCTGITGRYGSFRGPTAKTISEYTSNDTLNIDDNPSRLRLAFCQRSAMPRAYRVHVV